MSTLQPDFIEAFPIVNRREDTKLIGEHCTLTANDLVQMAGEARSPFTPKETYEYLDEEWETSAEVLNSNVGNISKALNRVHRWASILLPLSIPLVLILSGDAKQSKRSL
jgi:hypothetical protein